MLSLPLPSDKILNDYIKLVVDKAIRARDKCPNNIQNYFTNSKIEKILSVRPNDLLIFHDEYLNVFFPGRTDYQNYLDTKRIHKNNRTIAQRQLIADYQTIIDPTIKIFNYDAIISKNKKTSYEFAKLLDRNTCCYCNRQYTLTISNKDSHIMRPQFDHWFAKSIYPILALSFYNLIPSCSLCNSSIKGNDVFATGTHIHPYIQNDIQDNYTFSYKKKNVFVDNITITTTDPKIENCIEAFKLREVYNAHSAYELKDLLELRYKYPKDYIRTLLHDTFDKLHMSESEAYRIVFGTEYDSKDFHKRPFSKFKKDIIDELLNT